MTFDLDYQHELLRKMTNKTWMERTGCILEASMFDPDLEPAVKEVLLAWRKKRTTLSRPQLVQLCHRNQIKVPLKGEIGDNFAFDHQEVLSFARDRILREHLAKAHLYVDSGRHHEAVATIVDAKRKFPRAGMEETPDVLTTHMTPPTRKKLISTGLQLLDQPLGGGIAAEEIGTILAPTSGGKSSLLAFLAAQGVLNGLKVWYATLEVSEADIRGKIQRCLLRSEKVVPNLWKPMGIKLAKKGARLQVFETPPHTVGADELDGIIPDDTDLIIVDYADYLRSPNDAPGLAYENLGNIYVSLKQIAMQRKVSVWTASQVNRSAYEADEIYAQHVEASLKKMMVCDIAVSINQARSEQTPDVETHNSTGRLFIAKNRGGPRYVSIDITINWATTMFLCGRRA